jgi:hypothetical protein
MLTYVAAKISLLRCLFRNYIEIKQESLAILIKY